VRPLAATSQEPLHAPQSSLAPGRAGFADNRGVKRALLATAVPLALSVLAGCGGSGGPRSVTAADPAPPQRAQPEVGERLCRAGEEVPLVSRRLAYGAVVRRQAIVFRAPGRRPFATFGALDPNGARTVFGVLGQIVRGDCSAVWLAVELPTRPNGASGYVRASAVDVFAVRTRIVVDLSARRLTLYRDGRPVLRAVAGVGAPSTPTPTGRFYVDERLIPSDPSGPWGPGAIGLSAHSTVLRDWAQGGPIAIHGTDAPSSVGQAVSHGCIRLENAVLRKLFAQSPAGTPVLIRA
jgi:lipoprotein-anchoring transpeptidase ErfK/SrfK